MIQAGLEAGYIQRLSRPELRHPWLEISFPDRSVEVIPSVVSLMAQKHQAILIHAWLLHQGSHVNEEAVE